MIASAEITKVETNADINKNLYGLYTEITASAKGKRDSSKVSYLLSNSIIPV
jgi:hypothetical protein